MGYSEDDSMVRVDFFKPSGKWYTTEAVKWTGSYSVSDMNGKGQLLHDAFAKSLKDHFNGTSRLSEMDAICLEPYHEYSHPIQIKAGGWL
jgi:hypothetical protein